MEVLWRILNDLFFNIDGNKYLKTFNIIHLKSYHISIETIYQICYWTKIALNYTKNRIENHKVLKQITYYDYASNNESGTITFKYGG
jgi:hypothetical protein